MYFDPWDFYISYIVDPVSNFTQQNPLVLSILTCIILEIELLTALNSARARASFKLTNLSEFYFILKLAAVIS